MADEDEDVPAVLQAQDTGDVEDDEGNEEYLRTLNKLAYALPFALFALREPIN